jgi:hypothetical protein
MHKPKSKPFYRLTLKPDALKAYATAAKRPFRGIPISIKNGNADMAIAMSTADQLMTFAKPGENLSDTVLRILSKQKV